MGAEPAKWERYRALETNKAYRIVEVEHGADVARQFQAIAEGQPIGDQEPNGLQRIEETLAELEKARVIGGLNLRPIVDLQMLLFRDGVGRAALPDPVFPRAPAACVAGAGGAILCEKYGEAPIRVIRKSRPDEFGHQQYYDRLGYIDVYARYVDESEEDRQIECRSTPRHFMDAAKGHLLEGREHLDSSH